jgi:hypothetical protein
MAGVWPSMIKGFLTLRDPKFYLFLRRPMVAKPRPLS